MLPPSPGFVDLTKNTLPNLNLRLLLKTRLSQAHQEHCDAHHSLSTSSWRAIPSLLRMYFGLCPGARPHALQRPPFSRLRLVRRPVDRVGLGEQARLEFRRRLGARHQERVDLGRRRVVHPWTARQLAIVERIVVAVDVRLDQLAGLVVAIFEPTLDDNVDIGFEHRISGVRRGRPRRRARRSA